MSNPNVKPSDRAVVAAVIKPQSASSVQSSAYVSMGSAEGYDTVQAIICVGSTASGGTVDAKLRQATTSGGAGVKDITGKAITQLTDANGNATQRQAIINCRSDELDVAGGFCFMKLDITPATAASLITGLVIGHDARYQPATDATTVAEVVG